MALMVGRWRGRHAGSRARRDGGGTPGGDRTAYWVNCVPEL